MMVSLSDVGRVSVEPRARFASPCCRLLSAANCRQPVGRVLLMLLACALLTHPGGAAEPVLYAAPEAERARLLIHAATDRAVIEPVLRAFQAERPDVAVSYLDLNTNELFASVTRPPAGDAPDIVLSSAMDLQAKLVNDGWTQPHRSAATARVPAWANWRDEAFGFTLEPAVIVYRRDGIDPGALPGSRPALIRALADQPERYRGRVATYDIAASGVGYLFAAQDAVLSSQFWRLSLALGSVQVLLLPTSAEILGLIERGEVLIGYNVLGSYARAREQAGAPIGIIQPADYTLVMARVATIPAAAAHANLARLFLDWLLSERGQAAVGNVPGLTAIAPPGGPASLGGTGGSIQPIVLGPALLTFLDPLRKSRFLADWAVAVQPP